MESVAKRSSGKFYNNRHTQLITPPLLPPMMMIIWKIAVSLFSRLLIIALLTLIVANKTTYKRYSALN